MKMKNKSTRKLQFGIMSAILAMILCMAASLPAMAGTGGTEKNPATAELTKYLEYADVQGLTTPEVTFTFDFTAESKDGDKDDVDSMPTITSVTAPFAAGTTPNGVNGNMKQVKVITGNVLDSVTSWPGTGVYEYTVTESASGFPESSKESINYSQAKYTLTVVVSYNSENGHYFVEQTYINQVTADNGEDGEGKGETNPGDPDYNFEFTNTYSKQGGSSQGSNALTISKTTSGTGSDPSKQFTFIIMADDSVTGSAERETYTGTITRVVGSSGKETSVTLVANGDSQKFTLASGERIVFDTLPVGTTFKVEETGEAGYIPEYAATTAAGIPSSTGLRGDNLTTGSQTIGAIDNVVNFTNTYDESLIPTGVLSDIAPFLILIAAAVIAFVVFAAMSRRKANR